MLLLTVLIVFWQIEICYVRCLIEVRLYLDNWLFVKSIINKLCLRKLAFYAYSFYFINNLKGSGQDRENTKYNQSFSKVQQNRIVEDPSMFSSSLSFHFSLLQYLFLHFFILHMLISFLDKFLLLYVFFFSFVVRDKGYMESGWKIKIN